MKAATFLFVHRNAPAQFLHLIRHLSAAGHQVWFASQTVSQVLPPQVRTISLPESEGKDHASVKRFEQALHDKFLKQQRKGLHPDWILLHSGWGLGLSLKMVFPLARLLAYAEWWFQPDSEDVRFDPRNPEVSFRPSILLAQLQRNRSFAVELLDADLVVSPTAWQREQLPPLLRQACQVIHEGCDTAFFCPSPAPGPPPIDLAPTLAGLPEPGTTLITYATRGMDPYRGFPEWARAMVRLLQQRPDIHVAIAGRDRIVYAPVRRDRRYGEEARALMVEAGVAERVHFLDYLPLPAYRWLLRRSDLHTYFTRPYVLSWSLLDAMACGCAIVASDVAPVREVIRHGRQGWLLDHCADDLHHRILEALEAPGWPERRAAARRRIVRHYGIEQALRTYDRHLFSTSPSEHAKPRDRPGR